MLADDKIRGPTENRRPNHTALPQQATDGDSRGVASGDFADSIFQHLQLSDGEIFHRSSQRRGEHRGGGIGTDIPGYGFAAGHLSGQFRLL